MDSLIVGLGKLSAEIDSVLCKAENPAYDKAIKSKESLKFGKAMADAIHDQIMLFADEEIISQITRTEKVDIPIEIRESVNAWFLSLDQVIEVSIVDYYIYVGEIEGQQALTQLGIDATFGLTDPNVIKVLESRENLLIKSVDNTTKDWIAKTIANGKADGLLNREVAELLQSEEISKSRAEAIVRTETANAQAVVERQTFKKNNIKRWFWVTVGDDRVSDMDIENEAFSSGEAVPIGTIFPSGHEQRPSHVNCRCVMEPDTKDILNLDPYTGG